MIGAGGHLVADARGGIILSGDLGLALLCSIAARVRGSDLEASREILPNQLQ